MPRIKKGGPATVASLALGICNPTRLRHLCTSHHCGDIEEDDKQANEDALADGTRIFSAYLVRGDKT